jgi:hypothetical protein
MRIFHLILCQISAPGVVLLRACAFFTSFYVRYQLQVWFCYAHAHFSLILCQTKQDQLQVWCFYALAHVYLIYVRPSRISCRCGVVMRMRIFTLSMSYQAGSAPGVVFLRTCAFFYLIYVRPYVHSRVHSNTLIMGNPMPESTLALCQSRLCPSLGLRIWP